MALQLTGERCNLLGIKPELLCGGSRVRAVPDRVWVGDNNSLPHQGGGQLYLAVWLKGYSRKVVGWDVRDIMSHALRTASRPNWLKAESRLSEGIRHKRSANSDLLRRIHKHLNVPAEEVLELID